MGKLQICLDINPVTGKKDITVSYRSDEDALPMEHEDEHRRLVDALIEGDLAKAPEMRVSRAGAGTGMGREGAS
jgi:hypothetical protein